MLIDFISIIVMKNIEWGMRDEGWVLFLTGEKFFLRGNEGARRFRRYDTHRFLDYERVVQWESNFQMLFPIFQGVSSNHCFQQKERDCASVCWEQTQRAFQFLLKSKFQFRKRVILNFSSHNQSDERENKFWTRNKGDGKK
jgi:hypothetical protein